MRVLITAMAVVALLSLLDLHGSERAALAAEPKAPERSAFAIDRADLLLSPYVWKRSGSGETSRAEAAMPGAYLKVQFQGSGTVGLIVDGTANVGCPGPSMPVIEFSLDEKPFEVVPLVKSGEVYTLPLADGLEIAGRHRLEVYFRATDLTLDRWKSSATHLHWPASRWTKARPSCRIPGVPGRPSVSETRSRRGSESPDCLRPGNCWA